MVSKLVFKGAKEKKKRKRSPSINEIAKRKELAKDNQGGVGDQDWVTASSWNDLSGPIVLAIEADDGSPMAVASDLEGKMYISSELDIVDDNGVHSIEPTNVQQVFVLMPLNMLAGDSDKRSYDYALKSSEGKYLSIDSDGQVSCRASAMGPRQSFVFEEQGDKTWRLRTHLGTHLVISKSRRDASGFNVTTGAPVDGLANFLVRVQPRHRIVQKPGASDGQRYEKISSKALDEMAGRRLTDSEVRTLKRAHREGGLHEALLDIRQKGKSDSRS